MEFILREGGTIPGLLGNKVAGSIACLERTTQYLLLPTRTFKFDRCGQFHTIHYRTMSKVISRVLDAWKNRPQVRGFHARGLR